MAFSRGPVLVRDGLVLYYDVANIKSFRGEPTTNLSRNSKDLSGTQYASQNEWTSPSTVLLKTYFPNIKTPIGLGATLISESGNNGQHHLSRYGGSGEDGLRCLSCYIYPLASDITNFKIGLLGDSANLIRFNLNTGEITYGGGISNRNSFIQPVDGWPGWLWVGANFEGRSGGWVGSLGYDIDFAYTGTNGAKSCYITGIQYESNLIPTFFTEAQTTRGSTVATGGGLIDTSGNNTNAEINGCFYDRFNKGSLVFDGTDDYAFTTGVNTSDQMSISCWFKTATQQTNKYLVAMGLNLTSNNGFDLTFQNTQIGSFIAVSGSNSGGVLYTTNYYDNNWHHIMTTYNGSVARFYYDGVEVATRTGMSGGITIEATKRLNIGSWVNNGVNANASITLVSLYNRALTASEVLQNYNATKGRFI
jgi:hypothetical protein